MPTLDTKHLRQPRSVLVVDADPDVLALVSAILEGPAPAEKSRLRVLRARNIREAMDVLGRAYVPVDLVLSSQALPDIAEQVRAVRPRLPVMYMSAVAEAETIRIHGASGQQGFVRAVVAALEPPRTLRAAS